MALGGRGSSSPVQSALPTWRPATNTLPYASTATFVGSNPEHGSGCSCVAQSKCPSGSSLEAKELIQPLAGRVTLPGPGSKSVSAENKPAVWTFPVASTATPRTDASLICLAQTKLPLASSFEMKTS